MVNVSCRKHKLNSAAIRHNNPFSCITLDKGYTSAASPNRYDPKEPLANINPNVKPDAKARLVGNND